MNNDIPKEKMSQHSTYKDTILFRHTTQYLSLYIYDNENSTVTHMVRN